MGVLTGSARVFDLMHQKSNIEYRLMQLTRKINNLQEYSTFVGNNTPTIGEMLSMPGAMLGRTLNYMGMQQYIANQHVQANAPYMQQMAMQQNGGAAQSPEQQQQMNQYIMHQLYEAGIQKAKEIEERNLKFEEDKIRQEQERQKTLLAEVEQELKAARELRDTGIKEMAPKYTAGGQ